VRTSPALPSHTSPLHLAIAIATIATFVGCASGVTAPALPQTDIWKLYTDAVYDASVYRLPNLRKLRPLQFDSASRVTVVTLTSYTGYTIGADTLGRDVWVTEVPEVQDLCRTFTGNVGMRLRQLLGLTPDATITNFVVMSVARPDIFRPCTDPATTTFFPCADTSDPTCGEQFPSTASPDHVRWIADQMLSTYQVPNGYPWTRLGYTYDWYPDTARYGASEYVIRKGSVVTVSEIIPYDQYCSP